MRFAIAFALAMSLAACTGDVDEPWFLDHDRIVAVRATPPSIPSGQTSTLDGLVGMKGGTTMQAEPQGAQVVSPTSLSDTVSNVGGHWTVTAPSEDRLAAARTELKLTADKPVPLVIGVAYAGGALLATKTVYLGIAERDNPVLPDITFDGAPAPAEGTPITVDSLVKIPMSVPLSDVDYDVEWLTSVGTMHDFDLPSAYLKVEKDDPLDGQFAIVVRDAFGGVVWRLWPMTANPPPPAQ